MMDMYFLAKLEKHVFVNIKHMQSKNDKTKLLGFKFYKRLEIVLQKYKDIAATLINIKACRNQG